jgi:predicted acetyltransferase
MSSENADRTSYTSITIEKIQEEHIQQSCDLWVKEYQRQTRILKELARNWVTDSSQLRLFLKKHVESGRGIVALTEGDVVGYMVYDSFNFHGAEIVYCPIMGHSSVEPQRVRIYQNMYKHLSGLWVKESIIDHIITFFAPDTKLKDELYQRGFGLYTVDAYRLNEPVQSNCSASILKGSLDNIDDIMQIHNEFRAYMQEAPIFLVGNKENQEFYENFIINKDSAVFIAEVNGETVGFMSIRRSNEDDIITLATQNIGRIDKLGAYIKPLNRGQGIGTGLLKSVINWCREQGIEKIYVDYESANLYASGFWPKHFRPTMYSVKRRVNPDIIK